MSSAPEFIDAPPPKEQPTDLGFGSVVARESRARLLNRDGSFNVRRYGLGLLESLSLYHDLLTMSWPRFLSLVVAGYLAANTLFATAYYFCGDGALSGINSMTKGARFLGSFFFSVHTLATIGYGNIAPRTLAANVLVTIESLIGLLGVALVAGIMFAKFSRPTAQFLFSQNAIIAPYRDIRAFMFRIANRKKSQMVELEAKLLLSRWVAGVNGATREFVPLRLERDRVAFFPLTWTVVHPIDEESTLFGATPEDLTRWDAEFLILLSGIDETFAQTVHARSSYKANEVVWGAKFRSVFNRVGEDGVVSVNLRELHDIERAPL